MSDPPIDEPRSAFRRQPEFTAHYDLALLRRAIGSISQESEAGPPIAGASAKLPLNAAVLLTLIGLASSSLYHRPIAWRCFARHRG